MPFFKKKYNVLKIHTQTFLCTQFFLQNNEAKISNIAEVKELAASNWISTTCRDIQTAIIKTCAYNNRFALKCAFGESYNDLYPGTIYSPPSYDVRFPSAIMSS